MLFKKEENEAAVLLCKVAFAGGAIAGLILNVSSIIAVIVIIATMAYSL